MKKNYIFIVLFFQCFIIFGQPTIGGIGAISMGACSQAAHSVSYNTSTGGGSNTILIIWVCQIGNGSAPTAKFDGTSLTLHQTVTGGNNVKGYLFYLINPASGNKTAAITNPSSIDQSAIVVVYNNVDLTNPFETVTTATGLSALASVSTIVTPTASDLCLGFVGSNKTLTTTTNTSGGLGTNLASQSCSAASVEFQSVAGVSGGSVSKLTNVVTNDDWVMLGVGLRPYNPSVLGIELLYFNAVASGRFVLLNWANVTEENNSFYTIEKSTDAANFYEVGRVNSKAPGGNSSTTLNYSLTDYDPLIGTSYYRLKQTDKSGAVVYFGIERVDFEPVDFVSIFPNPAADEVTLSTKNTNQKVTLRTLTGQELLTLDVIPKDGKINTSRYPVGSYILTVGISSYKFVINR